MPHREHIDRLLDDPRIWQLGRGAAAHIRGIPSGWPALDEALGGGWPIGQLTELLPDVQGIGEFRLLMPAITALSSGLGDDSSGVCGEPGWVMLVAPPHIPYAPAFEAHGFDLSRLLVVRARRRMDALWAMEQALRSGTCAAVMAWSAVSDDRALRRLQLAAEEGDCWAVLFRPPGMQQAASPAALRVRLSRVAGDRELTLHILRQRHGPAAAVRVGI